MQTNMDATRSRPDYHSMEWGIKESFRSYFERLPDHEYGLSGGASRSADGRLAFPFDADASTESTLVFFGQVVLTAHFGALSVKIANPQIKSDDQGLATLTAEVDESEGRPIRMEIASLRKDSQPVDASSSVRFQAELAEEGQYLFMGNYFAGDSLDPVDIRSENS